MAWRQGYVMWDFLFAKLLEIDTTWSYRYRYLTAVTLIELHLSMHHNTLHYINGELLDETVTHLYNGDGQETP